MKVSNFLNRLRRALVALIGPQVSVQPKPVPSDADGASLPYPTRGFTHTRVPGNSGVPGPAAAASGVKPMRTLEELKTDLAELRASSKERHAPVPIQRQDTFDAGIFDHFVLSKNEPREPADGHDEYARTVYVPRAPAEPESTKQDPGQHRPRR